MTVHEISTLIGKKAKVLRPSTAEQSFPGIETKIKPGSECHLVERYATAIGWILRREKLGEDWTRPSAPIPAPISSEILCHFPSTWGVGGRSLRPHSLRMLARSRAVTWGSGFQRGMGWCHSLVQYKYPYIHTYNPKWHLSPSPAKGETLHFSLLMTSLPAGMPFALAVHCKWALSILGWVAVIPRWGESSVLSPGNFLRISLEKLYELCILLSVVACDGDFNLPCASALLGKPARRGGAGLLSSTFKAFSSSSCRLGRAPRWENQGGSIDLPDRAAPPRLFVFKLGLQLRERGLKSLALPLQRDSFLAILTELRSLTGQEWWGSMSRGQTEVSTEARLRVIQAEGSLGCLPSAQLDHRVSVSSATSESDRPGGTLPQPLTSPLFV